MEYIIIIIISIIGILILMLGMDIKPKDIKRIKELNENKELLSLLDKCPKNKQICEDILKILNNKNVKIEEAKDEKSQTSLYLVMQNKILIANIERSFTRIQTIAHECIHSIQNKKLLKFNFIFSNINILYFFIISILTIFKIINIQTINIILITLILMQFILYTIRSYLETDAMVRAEYISKEYLKEKEIFDVKTSNEILNKYEELNKIGIKLYNFILAIKSILKIIFYCIIVII